MSSFRAVCLAVPKLRALRLGAVPTAALLSVVAMTACGLHLQPMSEAIPKDEIVITEAEITRLRAVTAWEAVVRRVPGLIYDLDRNGEPTRVWRHGRGSLLNETPLLIVDGVRVADIRALAEMPVSEVEVIRVRTGLESSAEYGTNSAGGVILVETHRGN